MSRAQVKKLHGKMSKKGIQYSDKKKLRGQKKHLSAVDSDKACWCLVVMSYAGFNTSFWGFQLFHVWALNTETVETEAKKCCHPLQVLVLLSVRASRMSVVWTIR